LMHIDYFINLSVIIRGLGSPLRPILPSCPFLPFPSVLALIISSQPAEALASSWNQETQGSHQHLLWCPNAWLCFETFARLASYLLWSPSPSAFPFWSIQPWPHLSLRASGWNLPAGRLPCSCSTPQESGLLAQLPWAPLRWLIRSGHFLRLPWCTCLGSSHPWHFQRFPCLLQLSWVYHYMNEKVHSSCPRSFVVEMAVSQLFGLGGGRVPGVPDGLGILFDIFGERLGGDTWWWADLLSDVLLLFEHSFFSMCSFGFVVRGNFLIGIVLIIVGEKLERIWHGLMAKI